MRTRSQELRAKNRRIFAASYLIAALLIGGLFVWSPKYDVEAWETRDTEPATSAVIFTSPLFVQVLFGPPVILGTDGTSRAEAQDRTLEVGRVVLDVAEPL